MSLAWGALWGLGVHEHDSAGEDPLLSRDLFWERGGGKCEGEKWQEWWAEHGLWMRRAVGSCGTRGEPRIRIEATTTSIVVTKATLCSCYRSVGTYGFDFRNGIVQGACAVQCPSGCECGVVETYGEAHAHTEESQLGHQTDLRYDVCSRTDGWERQRL